MAHFFRHGCRLWNNTLPEEKNLADIEHGKVFMLKPLLWSGFLFEINKAVPFGSALVF